MNIYTVLDKKTKAYLRPFYMIADGQAIRAFKDLVNEPGHEFNKHPEDYTLYTLGTFDETSGTFETYEPQSLIPALSLYDENVELTNQKIPAMLKPQAE